MNSEAKNTGSAAEQNNTVSSPSDPERQSEAAVEASGVSPEQSVEAAAEDTDKSAAEPAAQEESVKPASEPAAQDKPSDNAESEQCAKKTKKNGRTVLKVLLTILIVLLALALLLAGAAFFTLRAMLTDEMPQAPGTSETSGTDIDALITSSADEILFEKKMSVDPSPFNALLEGARRSVNESADSFRVDELFCDFSDDKGSVYSRVHVDTVPVNGRELKVGRTIPVTLGFDVDFEEPYMVVIPSELSCGTVGIPSNIKQRLFDNVRLDGDTAFFKDGKIYIDVGMFNDYAAALTDDKAYEMIGEDDDAIDKFRKAFGDDSIFGLVKDSTELKISDVGLVGDRLVVYTDLSMVFNRVHESPGKDLIAGDQFYFGSYPQAAGGQPEPIKWIVLDVRDGKATAISQMLLDCKFYNDYYNDVTWSKCTLRKWLNNGFYDSAFSDEDKSRIQTVTNVNPDNPSGEGKGGPDTEDKVFCLSLDEAKMYGEDFTLSAAVTDYARSHGADASGHFILDEGKAGLWWLRSPGKHNKTAAYVYTDGYCYDSGLFVDLGKGNGQFNNIFNIHGVGVRPVIEVSLSE